MEWMNHKVELLAPARDFECGRAAIDCGADAVYIGAPRFGAREAAANPLETIGRLVEYAHVYWARVYVTLNTILRDEEVPAAADLAWQLHALGIDGLIIQDLGLLEYGLPPVPLIASTQMHNATLERVQFLERVGFQRVILARELSLEEIRTIRQHTAIALECFVHGALCVSYSGQCYLSYALGGRSGNRGQCAQPCRKSYRLVGAGGKTLAGPGHLLSLRDLNLSEHLHDLLAAGVRSFKIEGRLKDRHYVMNVVAHYRARLDSLLPAMGLRRASSGSVECGFVPDVQKTFQRGYTTYFLRGHQKSIATHDTPKMKGTLIGRVAHVAGNRVQLEKAVEISPGDGLCFFDSRGVLQGTRVRKSGDGYLVLEQSAGIRSGTDLYRNHDHVFLRTLEKSRPQRRIAVRLALIPTGSRYVLVATDEDGIEASHPIPHPGSTAQHPEQACETIRTQLSRCGNTPFDCKEVQVDSAEIPFFPLAVLNAARRNVLQALERARLDAFAATAGLTHRPSTPAWPAGFPEKSLSFEGNVLNRFAETFYRRHGVSQIEPAAESGLDLRGRRVMTCRYCLRRELGWCTGNNPNAAAPKESLFLVDAEGNWLGLNFDCQQCRMEVYLPREFKRSYQRARDRP